MKYVIIGNGVAGTEAALAIRKIDQQGEVTIVSSSKRLFYYRPKLVEYLAGTAQLPGITIYKDDYYRERNIRLVLGATVTGIDPDAHRVTTDQGLCLEYDRLLLATGADCFLPPFPGRDTTGVFIVRGVDNCDAIRQYVGNLERVAVIGGGLLGLETAYGLKTLGKQVTVIEVVNWLLPRQLDQEGGAFLQQLLENKGISFILGDTVMGIEAKDGRVAGVALKSGRRLDAQAVVVSAGIRGRDGLARQIKARINKGIVVDDYLQTSVPNIYAAGDPIEHQGRLYGIWSAAKEQGSIAGSNMAGRPLEYHGTALSSNLKITGIDLYSAGDYHSSSDEIILSKQNKTYKKYLIKDGKLAGAIVIGDAKAVKLATMVYQGKAPVTELKNTISEEVVMDQYECVACGYIYDPAQGDPDHGVPAGTPFEKLPADWVCPVCGVGKDQFDKVV